MGIVAVVDRDRVAEVVEALAIMAEDARNELVLRELADGVGRHPPIDDRCRLIDALGLEPELARDLGELLAERSPFALPAGVDTARLARRAPVGLVRQPQIHIARRRPHRDLDIATLFELFEQCRLDAAVPLLSALPQSRQLIVDVDTLPHLVERERDGLLAVPGHRLEDVPELAIGAGSHGNGLDVEVADANARRMQHSEAVVESSRRVDDDDVECGIRSSLLLAERRNPVDDDGVAADRQLRRVDDERVPLE